MVRKEHPAWEHEKVTRVAVSLRTRHQVSVASSSLTGLSGTLLQNSLT